jgi:hypothetical protein
MYQNVPKCSFSRLNNSSRVARKKRFHLRISSIMLFEGVFAELHEYTCMSKLGDLLEDRCVPILNSFANNFDAQTQKLSTFVLCLCTLCPLYCPAQYINITQKLTIFGSGRQSYLQSCLGGAKWRWPARRGLKCVSVFAKNFSVFAENVFVFARRC